MWRAGGGGEEREKTKEKEVKVEQAEKAEKVEKVEKVEEAGKRKEGGEAGKKEKEKTFLWPYRLALPWGPATARARRIPCLTNCRTGRTPARVRGVNPRCPDHRPCARS